MIIFTEFVLFHSKIFEIIQISFPFANVFLSWITQSFQKLTRNFNLIVVNKSDFCSLFWPSCSGFYFLNRISFSKTDALAFFYSLYRQRINWLFEDREGFVTLLYYHASHNILWKFKILIYILTRLLHAIACII